MIESAEEFVRLRRSSSHAEQMRASLEEAPLDVWFEVVANFPELREWVAQNKTVPLEILEALAQDPSANVRCVVAGRRKLTSALQSQLAKDTDSSVRARVAYNANCKIDTLRVLANVRIQPPGIDKPNAVPAASMRTWREFHGDLTEPG